ncbi:MAG: ATP-binding protein [Promethearchaeota archaeon]
MIENYLFNGIFFIVFTLFIIIIASNSHLLHGSYLWEYSKPVFYLVWRVYMRFEWAVMKVMYKICTSWLFRNSKVIRHFFGRLLQIAGNGEVYTLGECYKILDTLYRDYPHVYVAIRICPCRQAMQYYDKDISNITDLCFVFSDKPGKKKHMEYTMYISLDKAKKLLKKFDREGFVHTMFGGCAKMIDGSINLSICNCMRRRDGKGSGCIPLTLMVEHDAFFYEKPHNLAIIDQEKCKGAEECGKCIPYCQFDARVIDETNGKIKIINDKCYGCGLCLTHCPEGANTLKFLPENKVQFYQNLFKNIRKKYKKLPPEKHPKIRVESFPYNYALKSN